MALTIVKFPAPILLQRAEPVTVFDQALRDTVDEMFIAMYEHHGVGLAAPQVGISKRLFVVNPDPKTRDGEAVFVNPDLLDMSGEQIGEEGCLSIPDVRGKVKRAQWVVVQAQRLTGERFTVEVTDFVARIVQHEFDHIEGRLFIDKLSVADRAMVEGKLKSLRAEYAAEHPLRPASPTRGSKLPKKGKKH